MLIAARLQAKAAHHHRVRARIDALDFVVVCVGRVDYVLARIICVAEDRADAAAAPQDEGRSKLSAFLSDDFRRPPRQFGRIH